MGLAGAADDAARDASTQRSQQLFLQLAGPGRVLGTGAMDRGLELIARALNPLLESIPDHSEEPSLLPALEPRPWAVFAYFSGFPSPMALRPSCGPGEGVDGEALALLLDLTEAAALCHSCPNLANPNLANP